MKYLLVLMICNFACAASLEDSFKSQYPALESDRQEAYSHVRIVAAQTMTDRRGLFMWKDAAEFLREGSAVMVKRTALESPMIKNWPVGSVGAYGGTPEQYFDVFRHKSDKVFKFQGFGPRPDFNVFIHGVALPIYASYCIMDKTVMEYLNQDTVRIVSVIPGELDSKEVVVVSSEMTHPEIKTESGVWRTAFYFQPQTWLLMGWSSHDGDQLAPNAQWTFEQRMTYLPDSLPPRLKTVDYWIHKPARAEAKVNERMEEITRVDFGPLSPDSLKPSSLGITSLPNNEIGISHSDATTQPTSAVIVPPAVAIEMPVPPRLLGLAASSRPAGVKCQPRVRNNQAVTLF